MSRSAQVERVTRETKVSIELELDGSGITDVATGVPFFDHMLAQLGKHALLDLTVRTQGDIEIDAHHTVEDTALALGQALAEALGDKAGISRFGDALVPMDEALARAAGGPVRPPVRRALRAGWHGPADRYLRHHADPALLRVTGPHRGAVRDAPWTLLKGRNPHHIVEAQFKAVAPARCATPPPPDPQSPRRRHPQHQGHPVSPATDGRRCSTTARAICGRPSER